VRRTVPPSAEIEAQIDQLLAVGVGENPREALSELAKLGARLIIQRAVEDEFDAWLGRARYERRPEAPPLLRLLLGISVQAERSHRRLLGGWSTQRSHVSGSVEPVRADARDWGVRGCAGAEVAPDHHVSVELHLAVHP
jgi:hypothetical protein